MGRRRAPSLARAQLNDADAFNAPPRHAVPLQSGEGSTRWSHTRSEGDVRRIHSARGSKRQRLAGMVRDWLLGAYWLDVSA